MNYEDLTIKQVKEIQSMFGGGTKKSPVEIGKAYLFRTVTHIELGRVVAICGDFVTLEDASWVADTGRYHNALRDGLLRRRAGFVPCRRDEGRPDRRRDRDRRRTPLLGACS